MGKIYAEPIIINAKTLLKRSQINVVIADNTCAVHACINLYVHVHVRYNHPFLKACSLDMTASLWRGHKSWQQVVP